MPTTNKPSGLLLDTHIWVRYINGTPGLKAEGIATIESARKTGEAFVSVISVSEVALLVRKKRLNLSMTVERWVEQALRLPGVRLLLLTPEIAIESVQLPDSLNRDPSDRILVATARIESLRLMSRDKDIRRFAKQTGLSIEKA
jgi:PIN domain nuclease of toxin-antitoxin system